MLDLGSGSGEILSDLLSLAPESEIVVVRVSAPLDRCLGRIASRDPTHQIPLDLDVDGIREVYALGARVEVKAAVERRNDALSDAEIVSSLPGALAAGPGLSAEGGNPTRA